MSEVILYHHPLMLVICAKYEKNPSRTDNVKEVTQQDVQYFSSIFCIVIAKLPSKWRRRLKKKSLHVVHPFIHGWPHRLTERWTYSISPQTLTRVWSKRKQFWRWWECIIMLNITSIPLFSNFFSAVKTHANKRKPPCIGGMELVSLSCNRVFISAESVGRGWCKIAIAMKWYQFHTTDECGFLFMPWITDQLYICAIHKTSK